MMAERPFTEMWALVSLMGHDQVAGQVTEERREGCAPLIRVDVPAIGDVEPVTRWYTPGAIFSVQAVSKAWAQAWTERAYQRYARRLESADSIRADIKAEQERREAMAARDENDLPF